MITSCKNYITNNGANSIWDQPQQVVVDKIKAAIHLNQVPDDAFGLAVCVCEKSLPSLAFAPPRDLN